MIKKKLNKTIILFSLIFIVFFILVIFGIYHFIKISSNESLSNTRNGYTFGIDTYDKDGNVINYGSQQTSVGGTPGVFYISFKVLGSNIGNAQLVDLRLLESSPEQLTLALKKNSPTYPLALQPSLGIGQNNILLWNTDTSCILDSDCASNEKCIGSPKSCKVDVSNFLGNIPFNVKIEGGYFDAYGIRQAPVSAIVLYDLSFVPDEVILRTTAVNGQYGVSNTEVVTDTDNNGVLENFKYKRVLTLSYIPSAFISYTVEKNLVFICPKGICISQSTILNKDNPASVISWEYWAGGTLTTSTIPTEPYASENCAGIRPCQEVYIVGILPPTQTCGNSIREGTELCDTNDFGGDDCTTINQGFTSGTLQCDMITNPCQSWDTTQCIQDLSPVCGNGIIESPEICDSSNLNGQTCVSQGFTKGALKCSSTCLTFDTSKCR